MNEPRVRPDLNKLPLLEKLFTVNDHIFLFCVKLRVDLFSPVQDMLFFLCDDRQLSDQFFMHDRHALSASISFVSSIYSFALRLLFRYAMTGALLSWDHSTPLSTRI